MDGYVKIKGYEDYMINLEGKIFSIKNNKILKTSYQKSGYENVGLFKNGFGKQFRVHRLVAQNFIPNPNNLPQVNHKDGNNKNNYVENLEWCTPTENAIHRCRVLKRNLPPQNFLGKFGIEHNKSKQFWIKFKDDKIMFFGSGLEFTRYMKVNSSAISYARINYFSNNEKEYVFKRGALKGCVLYIENPL